MLEQSSKVFFSNDLRSLYAAPVAGGKEIRVDKEGVNHRLDLEVFERLSPKRLTKAHEPLGDPRSRLGHTMLGKQPSGHIASVYGQFAGV